MHLLELVEAFFNDLAINGLNGPAAMTFVIVGIILLLIIGIFNGILKNAGDKK